MPTQTKKATPTYGTPAATAEAKSSMQTMKKSGDADEQPRPVHARGEPAVERDESHQEERLARGGIRPHLCAAAQEDQRFAHRLDHRVADQEQEDVDEHQDRRQPFAGANIGEERQRAIEPGFLGGEGWKKVRHWGLQICC